MRHRKCGGVMIKILRTKERAAYQCNRCGKILTCYKRVATGGNPGRNNG